MIAIEEDVEQSAFAPPVRTFADLLALAAAAPIVLPPDDEPAADDVDDTLKPNEADDDPHNLARKNLERYKALTNGGTLAYYREKWYSCRPDRNHYVEIPLADFASKVGVAIKAELDRANIADQQAWKERRDQASASGKEINEARPVAKKVTRNLISNVIQAMAGTAQVSNRIEWNTYLPAKERRNWIALKNGIVDVDALVAGNNPDEVLLPHTSDWFSTVCLPYDFDPAAQCPRWEAFLHRCMDGDLSLIKILQEWAGYLLLPDTSRQKFLLNEGEGGNGKTVYSAGIQAMLGVDNCSFVGLERFSERFALTETLGKLVNICGDMGELDRVDEGQIKAFTGGDRMFFDRKNLSGLSCCPTARLMFNTNVRPRLGDKSSGIWRRLILVTWGAKIADEERVYGMDDAAWWQQAGELPGMFNWAILGLKRLREQKDFTPSESIKKAIESYRNENNPTREFLFEHYVEDKTMEGLSCKSLYTFYREYMASAGYHPLAEGAFGKEVKRCFPAMERKRVGSREDRYYAYNNIGLKPEEKAPAESEPSEPGELFETR